jgi:hypothetical protein
MSSKTNKALQKRVKQSNPQQTSDEGKRDSKLQTRKPGQAHFKAKDSGEKRQQKHRMNDVNLKQKDLDENLPHDQ